jgi:hypothetical protein
MLSAQLKLELIRGKIVVLTHQAAEFELFALSFSLQRATLLVRPVQRRAQLQQ